MCENTSEVSCKTLKKLYLYEAFNFQLDVAINWKLSE